MRLPVIATFTAFAVCRLNASEGVPADGEWSAAIKIAQMRLAEHRFAAAAEAAKQALGIAKRFGPTDTRVGVTYFEAGKIYQELGHCAESRLSFSHAADVFRKQPNPRPKYVFNSLISSLDVMCECEQYQAAAKKFREILPELESYRSDETDDRQLLGARGMIARALKHYREAETYYRQEIALLEKSPETNKLKIAQERVNLAMVLGQLGQHQESLAESQRVIDSLGDHADLYPATFAGALNNAACALADLGRQEEAQRTFERALQVSKDVYGEDHRFTARVLLNYSRLLREMKETPEAEAMQRRGVAAYRHAMLRDTSTVDVLDLKTR